MYIELAGPGLIGDRLQGGDDDGGVGEEVVIGADDDVELGAADEGALELARRRQRDALVQITVCNVSAALQTQTHARCAARA